MRKNWLAVGVVTCLAVGCAGKSTSSPSGVKLAANGRPETFGRPSIEQVSWTERIMAPFRDDPAAKLRHNAIEAAHVAEARRQQGDPVLPNQNAGPPTPELFISLAELHARGGNIAQARQFYQSALAAEPKNVDALLGAARMEDREGRLDVAVMLYQRAAAAHPKNPTVLNDLGLCLARQGKLPAAEQLLAQAVQLDPAKPLYRNNLAKVEVELNRLDAACQHLAAVYPPPVVNYNMGVLLYERGRTAEAQRFLLTAAGMDPALGAAQTLLAEIRAGQQPIYQVARANIAPAPTAMGVQQFPVTSVASPAVSAPQAPVVQPSPVTPVGPESAPPVVPQIIETLTPDMPAITAPALLPPVN